MATAAKSKGKTRATKNTGSKKGAKRWSKHVNETSNSLDLENSVFKKDNPAEIAVSLKASANKSHRRKGTPFQSAMSMLNFYINRAGKNLPDHQLSVLEKAKDELRKVFGREEK